MIIEPNLLQAVFQELFGTNDMHEKYEDNGVFFSIDSKKTDDNTMVITLHYKEDDSKKDFEEYVDNLDDEIFTEALEQTKKMIPNMEVIYESTDWEKVADTFQDNVNAVIENKIKNLKSFIR